KPFFAQRIGTIAYSVNAALFSTYGKELARGGAGGIAFGVGCDVTGVTWQPLTVILSVQQLKICGTKEVTVNAAAYDTGILYIQDSHNSGPKILFNRQSLSDADAITLSNPNEFRKKLEKRAREVLKYDDCEAIEIHAKGSER